MSETAQYPTAITSQLYEAVARLSTTLTEDITADSTDIKVASTTGFPASGFIVIENETIFYDSKDADSFTVSTGRGYAGTAAAHTATTAVRYAITAATINRIIAEIVAIETKLGITGAFNFVDKSSAENIAGVKTFSDTPKMDAIAEKTADAGVTVDGLKIKDGAPYKFSTAGKVLLNIAQKNLTSLFNAASGTAEQEVTGLRVSLPVIAGSCTVKITLKIHIITPAGFNYVKIKVGTSTSYLTNPEVSYVEIDGAKTIETLTDIVVTTADLTTQTYVVVCIQNNTNASGLSIYESSHRSTIVTEVIA